MLFMGQYLTIFRFVLTMNFLFVGLLSFSQDYENQWIVPTQSYLKIVVEKDGIYRVSGKEVAGLGNFDFKNLQLFYRGKQVAISISDDNDGKFDENDFFEFYGQKNSGSRDSLLYRNSERANPYHSLYSDESVYFVTVGESAGRRIEVSRETFQNLKDETYHIEEEVVVFSEQFSFNNIIGLVPFLQQSYFEKGEGRTGKFIVSDTAATFSVNLKNRVEYADLQPIIEYRINGRSRVLHNLKVSINAKSSTNFLLQPFEFETRKQTISSSEITNNSIQLKIESNQATELDWYSLTYLKVNYPQRIAMNGQLSKYFRFQNSKNSYTAFTIPDLTTNGTLWDVSDVFSPKILQSTVNQRYVINNNSDTTFLFATENIQKPKLIQKVNFMAQPSEVTNYLIITHETLLDAANEYATYRASTAGGSYQPLVVTIQQIYDTFNYGERNPMAIRAYTRYLLANAKPSNLLLIGRGVSFPDELRSDKYPDLVPTVGYPGSDVLLTAGLNGFNENVQALPTGRLNVTKNSEVLAYLAKVKEKEAIYTPSQWMKKVLHLSGGQSQNELLTLKSILENVQPTVSESFLGGKTLVKSKPTDEEVVQADIRKEINEGVGLLSYVGHGSASTLDFNIGYCSPPENGYTNKGKYPLMFFNGCGVGNVFYRYNALSTDWLLTPDKGAIAVLGNSFWSYAYPTQRFLEVFYEKLFEDEKTSNSTLGEVLQATNLALLPQAGNEYIKANMHQIILQGDPALRLFPIAAPDYFIDNNSIFVASANESRPISENDSLRVGVIIKNNGRFEKQQVVKLELQKTFANGLVELQTNAFQAVAFQDTVFLKIKKDVQLKSIELKIDGKNEIKELNENNNIGKLELSNWSSFQDKTSFPDNILPDRLPPVLIVRFDGKLLINNDIVANDALVEIELTDNNTLNLGVNKHLNVFLKSCATCSSIPIQINQKDNSFGINLLAESQLQNLAAGNYSLIITAADAAGNSLSKPYQAAFTIVDKMQPTELLLFPNPTKSFVQVRFKIVSVTAPKTARLLIYNTLGGLIAESELKPTVGENAFFYNTKELASGKYFVKLLINDAEEVMSKTFVVD